MQGGRRAASGRWRVRAAGAKTGEQGSLPCAHWQQCRAAAVKSDLNSYSNRFQIKFKSFKI
jgi:hypothetical protein